MLIPPPASADPGPAPTRAAWATTLRWLAGALLLAWLVVFAAWLVLQWGILPRIEQWRPDIEQRASRALGVPVRIGTIGVADAGGAWRWVRAIELRDVVLHEPASGRETLRLPRVRAALSPASLLPGWDGAWRLRFEQLLVDGADLDVRRDTRGRVFVAGLPADGASGDDGRAADWFFSQDEFAILGGRVTWTDELRGAPPLALSAVDLVVRNGVRRHALRLDATPPPDWGARFSLRAQLAQPLLCGGLLPRPGDWRRWRGTLHADLPAVDIAPLQRQVALPFELSQGRGALRAWIDVRDGAAIGATADLALQDVTLRLAADAAPLAFARITGRLAGQALASDGRSPGGALQATGLAFTTADGQEGPATDASLDWRLGADGRLAGGTLRADRLELAPLAQTLARLPPAWLAAGLPERLAELAPAGVAEAVAARWEGDPAAPRSYRVEAQLRGLALAAESAQSLAARAAAARAADPEDIDPPLGRPGLAGADIEFSATEAGGQARVALRDGWLEFPGVFEQPRVALQRLDTDLSWRIEPAAADAPPRVTLQARELRLANADAAGRFEARWSSGPAEARFPGLLELTGQLDRADATRVPRYLPLAIDAEVRDYLGRALLAGRASAVDVRLRGDLRDFPFDARHGGQGEFRIAAKLVGVRYTYLPALPADADSPARAAWPGFSEVQGELVFERAAMRLERLRGRLGTVGSGGFAFSEVSGGIPDLLDNATLALEGRGRGPLADALAFVQTTPVGGWLGDALAQAKAGGGTQAPVDLQLALDIPLFDSENSRVRGQLALAGNDLRLRPDVPLLADAKARIAFSEASFSLAGGSARVLGGEASFDGALQPDGSLRFQAVGRASVEALKRAPELAALARAAAPLSGQAGYRLALGFADGGTEWQLDSDLVGLAADLPAPLRKSAEQALPLRVQVAPVAGDGAPREQLRIELGAEPAGGGPRLLQAQFLRERAEGSAPRVLRGGIGVQDAAPQPASGVAASLKLARLDLDAWQRVAEAAGVTPGAASAAATPASGYAPTQLALRADELQLTDRKLTRVVAGLSRGQGPEAGLWRLNADADQLSGYAEYHPAGVRGAEGAGRVVARLARLALPQTESDAVGTLLEQAEPARLPALDLLVEELALRGKQLGRVEVTAHNRAAADGLPAWQLDRLRLTTPQARFDASGSWARRRTTLDFKLDIADGGALLARLGQPEVLSGAKGRLTGRLGWQGSPLALDHPSLDGRIQVEIERGQFLQADPGIAKLLGVLSLQSLPRRLLLDFRDVFGEGFAFDSIGGEVEIAAGVASTRNLRMRGVQAVVLMEGRADIARETQDLRVWVVPEINAATASLAYAVINPAVGLGSFIAQLLLRRPLAEAGTREFHVTGPWADPQVERVERQPGDRVPPTDAPASAPPDAPASAPPATDAPKESR